MLGMHPSDDIKPITKLSTYKIMFGTLARMQHLYETCSPR
jgi:hypothetical protein